MKFTTQPYANAIWDFKRRLIEHTLQAFGGNRTHAARSLGLQRTYFVRLMRELKISVPAPPRRTTANRTAE